MGKEVMNVKPMKTFRKEESPKLRLQVVYGLLRYLGFKLAEMLDEII